MSKPAPAHLSRPSDAMSERIKAKFSRFARRTMLANEALPRTISVWQLDDYVPPKNEPTRAGSGDFLRLKSRGF